MTRRPACLSAAALVATLGVGLPATLASRSRAVQPARADDRPNVVIILADDLGYGDLGSYGSPGISTPHLDRLAAEGQRWTSFYAGAPVCSPSRAALLTGRLPVRSGVFRHEPADTGPRSGPGVFDAQASYGLPLEEVTIAEMLKGRGYATMIVGKWHLGHRPEYAPARQGFDAHFGLPYSNDMGWAEGVKGGRDLIRTPRIDYWTVPLLRNGEVVERPVQQATLTRRYAEEAQRFIRAHRDRPFFLYVPHTMPHVPLFRSEAFAGKSARGLYGDVVEELDWSVGEILATLEAEGLERRTLVVFTSDNGPWTVFEDQGGSAGPLRDGKGTTWEGGLRVPGIFWMPGRVRPGVVRGIGATLDLLPTVAAVTGTALPGDRRIDGVDLSPALLRGEPSPREHFGFWRDAELFALRRGPWKAHFVTRGAYGVGRDRTVHAVPELYHLDADPGERHDVAGTHPEVVRDLVRLADTIRSAAEPAEPLIGKRP